MSKHTPGPWVVDEANTNLVARLVDGVYEYVCAVEPSSFSTREYNNEQEEADARLIAAAPELLEALKMGYADTMDYIQRNHLSGAENNRWLVLARAAITKAEGEKT